MYGIEGDYDGELLPVAQGVEILRLAGIESLVYTSPSYTDAKPRFRVLCPLSKPCSPQERIVYLARLNGVFGGIFANESFTLSQSYYFGSIANGHPMQCYSVAGAPIDTMPNLPSIGKKAEISKRVNGRRVNGGMKARDYDMALEALQSCPVPVGDERNSWLAISGAFFTATEGLESDARRLADWQAWNSSYKTNDPSGNMTAWRDFERNGTTHDFSTLAKMSNNTNAKAWAFFDGLKVQSNTLHDDFFIRWDLLETAAQAWIVEGIIPEGLCQIFGASGVGKSFVAISIGMSVAAGVPWLGHVIPGAGDVLLVCGEGKANIKKRMMAWYARYGQSISSPIPFYVSKTSVSFPEPASIAKVKHSIESKGIKPKLIIIDTFSRNFVGNENETRDMAEFIRAIDDLKDCYGASVLIVHHTGHGEKERARGSGVLKNATDAEYLVEKAKAGQMIFRCTKMKDAPEPEDKTFELAPVIMLTDGFPQTSVVLASAESSDLHERTIKTINLLAGREPVSKDDLFDLLVKEGILTGKLSSQERYFREILADFRDKKLNPQWVGGF